MIEHELSRLKAMAVCRRCVVSLFTISSILVVLVVLFPCLNAKQLNSPKRHVYHTTQQSQRLMVISLDGFRHDFIEAYNLKHFARFVEESSRAAYLNPQFTTQAFPNHWSMATGAYVETHGIVANKFYDPVYNEFFQENSRELKWWNETEPFWVSSVKQGLKVGIYHWPGSETHFEKNEEEDEEEEDHNDLYTYIPYNDNTPLAVKFNQSLKWLIYDNFQLVCLYHNQPDAIAHKYGLNSREFNVTLTQLDESFGSLIQQLKSSGLYSSRDFNLVVLSDHGMSPIKKNIFVNDYFDEHDAQIWSFSRNLIHLQPIIAMDILLAKIAKMPGITVTLKNHMPERLHYRDNRRIGEVIISALEGVGFIYMSREPMHFNGKISPVLLTYEQKKKLLLAVADKASHGYDKIYPNMRGIFIAHGPVFKQNYSPDEAVENVDVYPLVCYILGIECASRNGSLERVAHLLRSERGRAIVGTNGVADEIFDGFFANNFANPNRISNFNSYVKIVVFVVYFILFL